VTKRCDFLPLSILVGLALCIGQSCGANGQGLSANVKEAGVRHALMAAIEADRDAVAAQGNAEASNGSIDILVRILNYAPDYRYFGVVDGKFSRFDPREGAPAQQIWADQRCHQYRGLPKIWVLAINGRIIRGNTAFDVAARPRHIGELVPQDEIVVKRDPNVELDDPNQSLVTLATTTATRLRVALTLKSVKCRLGAD
jgi:hypothetical protein